MRCRLFPLSCRSQSSSLRTAVTTNLSQYSIVCATEYHAIAMISGLAGRCLLRPENIPYYSAVLISGAGNDAVDYKLGLKKNCAKAQTPEECIDDVAMDALMGRLGTALGALIHQVWRAAGKQGLHPAVVLHSYDYPIPDGRGFKLEALKITGPWLAPAMDERQVPKDPDLRRKTCRILIDHLAAEFAQFVDPVKRIYLVDSRGCLVSPNYLDDWDNELHPTRQGFQRIVNERWIDTLKELAIAV